MSYLDTAIGLATNAFAKDELEKLFLGTAEYRYKPPRSFSNTNTDIVAIMMAIRSLAKNNPVLGVNHKLSVFLVDFAKSYQGIIPVASIILLETSSNEKTVLNLDLEMLAEILKGSIKKYTSDLSNDRTEEGKDYVDGKLGELRRMNRITVDDGGPYFLPDGCL